MIFLYLQIAFTIISAIFLAAILPIGAFLGWTQAITCAALAALFFIAMLFCKQAHLARHPQETQETPNDEQPNDDK